MPRCVSVTGIMGESLDNNALISRRKEGLYCAAGDFYIDPMRPVERAIVTHAHSDHARSGSRAYLCAQSGKALLHARIGKDAPIEGMAFGERRTLNGVSVSLHPAGHILGSAQVRVAHGGRVTVVTGDYKIAQDATCEAFEPVPCQTFITECTFGLPVYRWPDVSAVAQQLNAWWRDNQKAGRTSLCYVYALGKAQRVLSLLDPAIGPIGVHGAVANFLPLYAEQGISLPSAQKVSKDSLPELKGRGIVLAPGSVQGTPWERKLGPVSRASASGWMAVRGARRRQALDRGFVLSDHCDWPGLLQAIAATGASCIGLMHGQTDVLARYLQETRGLQTAHYGSLRDTPDATQNLDPSQNAE